MAEIWKRCGVEDWRKVEMRVVASWLWRDGQMVVLQRCHLSAKETCQVEGLEECRAAWVEVRQHRESPHRHFPASVFDIAGLQR